MNRFEHLLELESIKRLKARYFRCLDTKDWEGWLSVFTEDATLEFDMEVSTPPRKCHKTHKLQGKKEIAKFVRSC